MTFLKGRDHTGSIWYAGQRVNCIVDGSAGIQHVGEKRIAEVLAGPDTFFSVPARVSLGGKKVRGFLTTDDRGGFVFTMDKFHE